MNTRVDRNSLDYEAIFERMGKTVDTVFSARRGIGARTKRLVTISDQHPDDQNGYRSRYGIEDAHQVPIEVYYQGVHAECRRSNGLSCPYVWLTDFAAVSDVHKLPCKVSDIYRRIIR